MDGLGQLYAIPILDLLDERVPLPGKPLQARIDEVQKVVAGAYGVTVYDIKSPDRRASFVRPRQIAAMLCYELTGNSYPTIARHFGNRDHTTILFAYRKVKRLAMESASMADELAIHRQAISALVAMRAHPVVIDLPRKADTMTSAWAIRHKRPRVSHQVQLEVAA